MAASSASAYPPADKQATFYEGLQNYQKVFEYTAPDTDESMVLGEIKHQNLVRKTLAPWYEGSVNAAIAQYRKEASTVTRNSLKSFLREQLKKPSATVDLLQVRAYEVVASAAKTSRYYASGRAVSQKDIDQYTLLILKHELFGRFEESGKAITVSDAHAQFVPSDEAITNDLAGKANTASDQKTSSMIIPANSPVYVLGQMEDVPEYSPETDSWLLIWRPECGIKFVRSSHVALLDAKETASYQSMAEKSLYMATSDRVKVRQAFRQPVDLMRTTLLVSDEQNYYMAVADEDSFEEAPAATNKPRLLKGNLVQVTPKVKDRGELLINHLQKTPVTFTFNNYLAQLHRTTFSTPLRARKHVNIPFGWGDAVIGADNFHGQDVSNFVRKVMLPFGLSLPRHSKDQIDEGLETQRIYDSTSTGESDSDSLYAALVKHCMPGRFVSFGPGSQAACLGSLTVEELQSLDPKAAEDAKRSGIEYDEEVPLIAMSPVGLNASGTWYITGLTGIYPVFKSAPYNAWITRSQLFIFSYFKKPALSPRGDEL